MAARPADLGINGFRVWGAFEDDDAYLDADGTGWPHGAADELARVRSEAAVLSATPTGPFYTADTPEWLLLAILSVLGPPYDLAGDVPQLPPTLGEIDRDAPTTGEKSLRSLFEQIHPRDQAGRFREKFGPEAEAAFEIALERVRKRRAAVAMRKGGDQMMAAIVNESDRKQKPLVVDHDDFEKLAAAGEVQGPWLRGISTRDYAEDWLYGDDFYVGAGQFGSGSYFARDKTVAETYTSTTTGEPGGVIMQIGLRKDAKVIPYDEARGRARQESLSLVRDVSFDPTRKRTPEQEEKLAFHTLLCDPGRWAALNGYDAIYVPTTGEGFLVVLNRGAVVADSEIMQP